MSTGVAETTVCTTCPYCGVGCGVLATPSEDGMFADIKGDPDHPANYGRLCSKGSALGETLTLSERLLYPEMYGQRASWDIALNEVADRFKKAIAEHGPDSVAFYVSGQLLTEDYYVANKLMKGAIGSSNIDTNSRLCMASSVAGHKRAFGSDTVPGCYEDLELADLVVLVGSNFAWCHPVLHQRLLAAKEHRDLKLVVIDPRETATSQVADLHLKIKPGGDVALFNGLMSYLAESPAFDPEYIRNHTNGFEQALASAQSDIETTAQTTGLTIAQLELFYSWVAKTDNTMTVYSQGVNQSSAGTDKVNAIINTHLATGRIGKPGMGPFSITGQPNAMGGREVGGLANQLVAHMDFAAADVERVQRFWNSKTIASKPGLKAVDLFDAVDQGKIKALWIMATNPAVSMPEADKVKRAIEKCDFVVVSDIVSTSDTVKLAHVRLPATGWGEKTGTVTNSERRISRQRRFLKSPGEARHDWDIISDVARRMRFDGFRYTHEAEIFREYAQLSDFENDGQRDFDIGKFSNITIDAYEAFTPVQWPAPKSEIGSAANKRFFSEGQFYTSNGKARFIPVSYVEPTSKGAGTNYDLVLNTGRIRDQWHTMTRTGKTSRLNSHIAEPFLEIHPIDAEKYGVDHADLVKVMSEHGQAVLRVLITERVETGQVFAPMHWTRRFSSNGCIDALVGPEVDPVSGQPEAKYTPVRIRKMKLDWFGFAALSEEPDQEVLRELEYWCVARRSYGWGIEFAGGNTVNLQELERKMLGREENLESIQGLARGQRRSLRSDDNMLIGVFLTQADTPLKADRNWLCSLIGQSVVSIDNLHILGGFPASGDAVGRVVCSCMGVTSGKIEAAVQEGAQTVADIGKCTSAGTNCGSCKIEISQILEKILAADISAREAAE